MLHPARASSSAIPLPIPLLAPVMRALRPSKGSDMRSVYTGVSQVLRVENDRYPRFVEHGFDFEFTQARSVVINNQLVARIARLNAQHAVDTMHPRNLLHHGFIHRSHEVVAQL